MKKYLLIIMMFTVCSTYAQRTSPIRIGFKIAPELSFRIAGWEAGKGYGYTFGQLGVVVGAQLLARHIETGIYYYRQNVIENHSYGYDIHFTPQFLHIPVAWRQEIKNFYFTVGGSLNINLGVTKNIENQTSPGTVTFVDKDNNGDSVAFGIHATAGYTLKLSDKINFFSELRLGSLVHKFTPATGGIGLGVNCSL